MSLPWCPVPPSKSEHGLQPLIEGTCERVEHTEDDLLSIGVDIGGISPTEISRYRDCIVCDKSFKKPHEGEYRCESCRAKVLEDERRDRAGKQLLDANARVKP